MKYNIGDKVKIKRHLVVEKRYGDNSYVGCMDECAKNHDYVLTVGQYSWGTTQYCMLECKGYNWTEEMIEGLAEDEELNKFEAFLREVADQNSSHYSYERDWLRDLTNGDYVDESVANLVEFYKTFEPKPKKKKLTMAELRDIVGEDFEIVKGENYEV